ncbi:hypothetical protein F4779DRAFT_597105, partial [Xylariaceae sp. FL0662B]
MLATYSTLALIACALAFPAPLPTSSIKADLGEGLGLNIDPAEVLNNVEKLFEQTCHDICLKTFPEEGPKQDYCMKICHRHSGSGDSDQDSGMYENSLSV